MKEVHEPLAAPATTRKGVQALRQELAAAQAEVMRLEAALECAEWLQEYEISDPK